MLKNGITHWNSEYDTAEAAIIKWIPGLTMAFFIISLTASGRLGMLCNQWSYVHVETLNRKQEAQNQGTKFPG